MKYVSFALAADLITFSCLSEAAPMDSAKVHGDLASALRSNRSVNVIIRFRSAPDARLNLLIERNGGQLLQELGLINAAAYRIKAANIAKLAANAEIEGISLDQQVKATMDITAATVGATAAWNTYGLTGKGVGVAVIDSGVANHSDLGKRVVCSTYYRADTTTDDLAGHGTHVAGIIAGDGTESKGGAYKRTFKGIAPGANIVNIAVLDRYNSGTDASVLAGIQKAVALKSTVQYPGDQFVAWPSRSTELQD